VTRRKTSSERGRHTKVDKASVISLLVQGVSVRDAGRQLGIKPATIYAWRRDDPEFRSMLEAAEVDASEAVISEGVRLAVQGIQELMPRAQEKLAELLDHADPRIRAQAISLVFRVGKPMADVNVNVGFEAQLAQVSGGPADGD
jgi:transposase-like protein